MNLRALRFWVAALGFSLSAGAAEFPGAAWETTSAIDAGLDEKRLIEACDYALTGGGSGYITRGGKLVMSWGDPKKLYDLKSSTKSFGAAALGLAITEGKIQLSDKAAAYHPAFGIPPESNKVKGWLTEITIFHLATQTAGFEKPGGYEPLTFAPGTRWSYSDGGPNWLAECLTHIYGRDLNEVMFERVFAPIGIRESDLRWRKNAYRPEFIETKTGAVKRREFGAGIHANVDAMARFGYLHLRNGEWNEKRILAREFIEQARAVPVSVAGLPVNKPEEHGRASSHYGFLWWNNADGTLADVPRDAYWSWGLYDSMIVVIPSLDLVVARAGSSWKREKDAEHYAVLKPFFEPIVRAAQPAAQKPRGSAALPETAWSTPPYPASGVIRGIEWAPAEKIIRQAKGSDNWPVTWGDDDALYTAYGDGNGFEPRVPKKLSLGLAKITGMPPRVEGTNLRAASIETLGDGARGEKASGMLMVEGVLHLWLRNATNAQLAWSEDRGATWKRADWKFTRSFGAPTFLNFGKNYEGARDGFVYVYSHDSDSAYEPSDRMVLARVPKDRVRERSAYEFLKQAGEDGPVWTNNLEERGAVFENRGKCYRSGISYNAGLKRYLWCQTLPGTDARFGGGFGIYDAPEPWGPWTTVFHTNNWDVGPGETSSFPTNWFSADGLSGWLVFSGDDSFSVREARFVTK
jgi:CubicO group peptidase (beta-lactamase class C family)